jgi:hypothetical protein
MVTKQTVDADQLRHWIEVEKLTQREVADRLGVKNQTISKWCRAFGIRAQRRGPRSGPGHPNWKGGRIRDRHGYVLCWTADHPHARKQRRVHGGGYVLEHRLVMEKHLGRHLDPKEVVHHKNGVHDDNRIENLELFASNADHLRHELTGRVPNWTEDGKARIRAGVEKAAANRRKSRRGEKPSP